MYSLSIPQDRYCRDQCRCRCGYWLERDIDGWAFPPTNPAVVMHSTGERFYDRWLKEEAPRLRRSLGDIWSSGEV